MKLKWVLCGVPQKVGEAGHSSFSPFLVRGTLVAGNSLLEPSTASLGDGMQRAKMKLFLLLCWCDILRCFVLLCC